jgi:hypothetical protein
MGALGFQNYSQLLKLQAVIMTSEILKYRWISLVDLFEEWKWPTLSINSIIAVCRTLPMWTVDWNPLEIDLAWNRRKISASKLIQAWGLRQGDTITIPWKWTDNVKLEAAEHHNFNKHANAVLRTCIFWL